MLRQQGFKLAVIDTPPAITMAIQSVISVAELIVIPTRPSPHDLRAVGATVDLCERAGKPLIFVVNAATPKAKITREAAVALSQHGTVAPITLHHRTDFAASMIDGRTVMEVDPERHVRRPRSPRCGRYISDRLEKNFRRTVFARADARQRLRAARRSGGFGRRVVSRDVRVTAKPFASLSSGLLARKGQARPAMRPQGFAGLGAAAHDDLGWNDMGERRASRRRSPPVLVERDALRRMRSSRPPSSPSRDAAARRSRAAAAARLARDRVAPARTGAKRKAAFTLRLDADRHLRLRLASALARPLRAAAGDRGARRVPVAPCPRSTRSSPAPRRQAASIQGA